MHVVIVLEVLDMRELKRKSIKSISLDTWLTVIK